MAGGEDSAGGDEALRLGLGPGARASLRFVDRGGRRHVLGVAVEGPDGGSAEGCLPVRVVRAGGATVVPDIGQSVSLVVGPPGAEMLAYARVLERGSPEAPLVLSRPVRQRSESRRQLFRVDVRLAAETSLGPATAVNLSGGGCLLRLDAASLPEPGDTLELVLPLPGRTEPLRLRARVVRQRPAEAGGLLVGLAFPSLPRREENALVAYVARRQQELLRRGLLPAERRPGPLGPSP